MPMNLKKIDSNIVLIGRTGAELNELIQETAVGILQHAEKHGDCTRALRLVQAMPKSFRRNLLITWFGTFGPIGMNVSTGKVGLHRPNSKLYKPFDVAAAKATPWYNQPQAAPEELPDTTVADVREAVTKLAARFQKKLDAGEVANDDIEAVNAVLAAIKAA